MSARLSVLKDVVHRLQMLSDPVVVAWVTLTLGRLVYFLDRRSHE